jgi:aspartyl-tRNA(Asn)/glutamyl-tRNA(Gln) amidotransferase subunit C
MRLSREEVEHIARLARLDLAEDELTRYQEQLSAILEYAQSLQAVETGEIEPTSSVLPPRSVLRADEPGAVFSAEELFANAPDMQDNQFKVPPVFEGGSDA